MATPLQRIVALEAHARGTDQNFVLVGQRLDHLTSAVGDLSQGQRALQLDMTELRSDVTELRTDVTGIKQTLHGHEELLRGHGVLLQAIAAKLGIEGSTETPLPVL